MAATATVEQIRAGLVANLATLGIQSTGYILSEPMPPSIEIAPRTKDYDLAGSRGLDLRLYMVRVTIKPGLDVPMQKTLGSYMDPSGASSVKTLIEAAPTLGGVVQDLRVVEDTGQQEVTMKDGNVALACTWTVEVYE